MKKKIFTTVWCICIAASVLTACNGKYPSIRVIREGSSDDINIDVGNKYKFDNYEKSGTDDGCVVSIYFKNAKSN